MDYKTSREISDSLSEIQCILGQIHEQQALIHRALHYMNQMGKLSESEKIHYSEILDTIGGNS